MAPSHKGTQPQRGGMAHRAPTELAIPALERTINIAALRACQTTASTLIQRQCTPALSPSEGERVPVRAGEGESQASPSVHGSGGLSLGSLRYGTARLRLFVFRISGFLRISDFGFRICVHCTSGLSSLPRPLIQSTRT